MLPSRACSLSGLFCEAEGAGEFTVPYAITLSYLQGCRCFARGSLKDGQISVSAVTDNNSDVVDLSLCSCESVDNVTRDGILERNACPVRTVPEACGNIVFVDLRRLEHSHVYEPAAVNTAP